MEDFEIVLTLARYPRRPGSGRQTTRRPFPLTARIAAWAQKRVLNEGVADAHGKIPLRQTPIAADLIARVETAFGQSEQPCDSLHQEQHQQQHQYNQDASPQVLTSAVNAGAQAEARILELQSGLGQRFRAQVEAIRRAGSGRQTTRRPFVLKVTLPPLRFHVEPPQPQPQPSPSPQQPTRQPLGLQQPPPQPAEPLPNDLPSLWEYVQVVQAVEARRRSPWVVPTLSETFSVEEALQLLPGRLPSVADLMRIAREVDVKRAAEAAASALPGHAEMAQAGVSAAVTPTPRRATGVCPAALSPQPCTPWQAPTPMEGVPERLSFPGTPSNAAAAAAQMDREQCENAVAATAACSTQSSVDTPIEGVPERLTKRRRVSVLPSTQLPLAAVENTSRALNRLVAPGAKGNGRVSAADERHSGSLVGHQPGAPVVAGAVEAGQGSPEVVPSGVATAEPTMEDFVDRESDAADIREALAGHLTAPEIAAAAVAAARAALERLQASAATTSEGASDQPVQATVPSAAALQDLSLALGEPSSTSISSCTPAVVKMQNLAMAVEDAVQRAAQAMRGAPSGSCRSSHFTQCAPRTGLPPRPPSAGRLAPRHVAAASAGVADTLGQVAEEGLQRQSPSVSDALAGFGNIIHRVPSGVVNFHSFAPSPAPGFGFVPPSRDPGLHTTGRASSGAAPAAAPGPTPASFNGGSAAGAFGSVASLPVVADDRVGADDAGHGSNRTGDRSPGDRGPLPDALAAGGPAAETPLGSFRGGAGGRAGDQLPAADLNGDLSSALRHDLERQDVDYDQPAPEEVRALPDESSGSGAAPATQGSGQSTSRGAALGVGSGSGSQLMAGQYAADAAAAAAAGALGCQAAQRASDGLLQGQQQGPSLEPRFVAGRIAGYGAAQRRTASAPFAQPGANVDLYRAVQEGAGLRNRGPSPLGGVCPMLTQLVLEPHAAVAAAGRASGAGMPAIAPPVSLALLVGSATAAAVAAAETSALPGFSAKHGGFAGSRPGASGGSGSNGSSQRSGAGNLSGAHGDAARAPAGGPQRHHPCQLLPGADMDDDEYHDDGDYDGHDDSDDDASAADMGAFAPEPSAALPSVLRHDLERRDSDDEDVAVEEVRALPDEPVAAQGECQDASKRSGGSHSAGVNGQRSAEQQQAQPAEVARGRRATESNTHERRFAGNRKSLAGDGLTIDEELGTRRSTRNRVRPLEYWRGEAKSYGRDHVTMPTVAAIKMRTPEPQWPLPSGKQGKAKRQARTKAA